MGGVFRKLTNFETNAFSRSCTKLRFHCVQKFNSLNDVASLNFILQSA